jgi:hypothetical protein
MTSSGTPTDNDGTRAPRAAASPAARAAAIAAGVIVIGAVFIAWSHRFHVTVPVVIMTLGWIAVVSTVYTLIRIGTTASEHDPDEVAWWKPTGKREELEREKRSLLKAIKEIEFDREMGKMTDADAAEILRVYRGHAIEVIKALDHVDSGGPRSVREEIEREVKARLAVTATKPGASKPGKGKPGKGGTPAEVAAEPVAEAPPPPADAAADSTSAKESAS